MGRKRSSGAGHNAMGGADPGRLKSFVERIERLNEEKAALGKDITGVFAEAKGAGFDVKALREVIRQRKMDASDRAEFQAIVETYQRALGDFVNTPLGQAGAPRVGKDAAAGD